MRCRAMVTRRRFGDFPLISSQEEERGTKQESYKSSTVAPLEPALYGDFLTTH